MPVSDYGPIFDAAGKEWNVDPNLLRAMATQESGGNPGAVSPKGAAGVMQIMPGTGQDMGMTDPTDPAQSIFAGAKYMSQLLDKYKDPAKALAAYNAGPQRVDDVLAGKAQLPQETAAYVPAVAAHYGKLSVPAAPSAPVAQPTDESPADFLARTANASPTQEDPAAFLARTGGATPQPAAPTPPQQTGVDDLGRPIYDDGSTPPAAIPSIKLPQTTDDVRALMAEKPGYTASSILPIRVKNDANGQADPSLGVEADWAAPIRAPVNALMDLFDGPKTGVVTPAATGLLAGAALGGGLAPSLARGTGAAIADAADAPLSAAFKANPGVVTPSLTGEASANPLVADGKAIAGPAVADAAANPLAAPLLDAKGNPLPQSVGAAYSRDMSAPEALSAPKSPAQKIRDLETSVNQTAEDRAGPQMVDTTQYVPGIPPRLLASSEFSPANALDEKVAIGTDPAFRAEVEANARERNNGMVDLLRNDAQDALALEKAHEDRAEVSPSTLGVFDNEQPVDASGLVNTIQGILAGPDGKRAAVQNTMNSVLKSLHDNDGNLETLPSQLYGARKNLTDMLKKGVKGTGDVADDVRASKSVLNSLLPAFDQTIGSGAPKFDTVYLPQYHALSQPINQMEFLQKYQSGPKKITDGNGYLVPNKVQKMLDDVLQGNKASGVNGAKTLTDDQIQNIINVRNELAAGSLKDRMASVKGSDSFQQINRAIAPQSTPGIAALKGAGVMGTHAALAASPAAGWGNALLGAYQGIVKPAVNAAKAQKAAEAIAARKSALLQPSNPLMN